MAWFRLFFLFYNLNFILPTFYISGFKILKANIASKTELNDNMQLTKEPPKRVLLLVEPTPFNYISGYANRFKEMLKYLKKAGDIVHIITPDADKNAPDEYLGYPITTLKGFSFPLYNDVRISMDLAKKTDEVIKEFKPDIIHVTSPGFILFRAIASARKFNIPIVMSYHTNLAVYAETYFVVGGIIVPGIKKFAEYLIRRLHSQADLTLVTSEQLKKDLTDIGVKRVDIWQKGINVERFSPDFKSSKMRSILTDGHPESPLIIYVGRLGMEKRLVALKRVLEENPSVRLAFVGKGPYENELKEFYKNYNVVFTGQYTGDTLSEAYSSADIFVMPSDSETLGFVVLEAMASGVPVVGVAAGGLKELISNEENGYLVSNTDGFEEFSRKVSFLVNNPEIRENMGINARKWAEKFGWEAATAKLRNSQYKLAIDLCKYCRVPERKNSAHMDDLVQAFMDTNSMV